MVVSVDLSVFGVLTFGFDLVVVTSDFCLLWRRLGSEVLLGRFLGFAVSGVLDVLSLVWLGLVGWLFSGFGGCVLLRGFVWYRLFILGRWWLSWWFGFLGWFLLVCLLFGVFR